MWAIVALLGVIAYFIKEWVKSYSKMGEDVGEIKITLAINKEKQSSLENRVEVIEEKINLKKKIVT